MAQPRNRSALMKKYELAYETCVKKAMKKSPVLAKKKPSKLKSRCLKKVSSELIKSLKHRINSLKTKKSKKTLKSHSRKPKVGKSRRVTPVSKTKKTINKSTKSKKTKKSLNSYQKFVREKSKDPKLQGISPPKRMKEISKMWHKSKKE